MDQSAISEEDPGLQPLPKTHFLSAREHLALKIDRYSAIVFPTLFALFNIFYWYHYLVE